MEMGNVQMGSLGRIHCGVYTDEEVFVTASQEKWEKSRRYIGEIIVELKSSRGVLDFKGLERKQGFLIYITRTYPSMVPYLKGIHQMLDSWRPH